MIHIVLADDQALIREGFRSIRERADDLHVVGDAVDGLDAVAMVRRTRPDIVLMDVRMPRLDGIAATAQICADPALVGTRVIVITTYEVDDYIYAALRAGASGFLLKDLEPDELRRAVRVVAAGEALLAPSVTRRLIAQFSQGPRRPPEYRSQLKEKVGLLTQREREVVTLVGSGLTNDEIATRLVISPTTAKTHVSRAMFKLGVRDRAQVVVFAYDAGLVNPPSPG
jgi:DNA-binding NarL/FixJ family response regulator